MSQRPPPLFRVGGLPVHGRPAWFAGMTFLAVLLATSSVETSLPGEPLALHLALGLAAAAGVVGSLVLHDLPSAWVARRAGAPDAGAAPWLLGAESPARAAPAPSAGAELLVALLRPTAAFALATAGFFAGIGAEVLGGAAIVAPALFHFAWMNTLVAGFDLLPGLPLSGGRLVRGIAWRMGGDVDEATRIACRVGRGLGSALLFLGALVALAGSALVGVWLALVGAFLRRGADLPGTRSAPANAPGT